MILWSHSGYIWPTKFSDQLDVVCERKGIKLKTRFGSSICLLQEVLFSFVLTEMETKGKDFGEGLEIKWFFSCVICELLSGHLNRY